jgi:putative spermidine/putrescine transport system ATP-binding protein
MATVELRNVTKSYHSSTVVSVDSLRIEDGEFVALLGPSGCGKTTTLRMIAGFTEPSTGEILVDGHSMRGMPPHRRNIGVVFQSYALFPHLSVFDNVAFGLRMRNMQKAEIAPRVERILDLVRLSGFEQRYPKQLSGGQQQRVAIARALVIEPSVLLLDEPLSNLDANLRNQMRFEIREIQKRSGITTVFVTHDQEEAMAAADRLVVMSQGRIAQVGTAREIYKTPHDRFVATFIGQANLLGGRVLGIEGGVARFQLDRGDVVTAQARDDIAVGQNALLAIRPENLKVVPAGGEASGGLKATVVQATYLGASLHVSLRSGEVSLSATLPSHFQLESGQNVILKWDQNSGILLPE